MIDNVYEDYTYRANDEVAGDFKDILTGSINAAASYGASTSRSIRSMF